MEFLVQTKNFLLALCRLRKIVELWPCQSRLYSSINSTLFTMWLWPKAIWRSFDKLREIKNQEAKGNKRECKRKEINKDSFYFGRTKVKTYTETVHYFSRCFKGTELAKARLLRSIPSFFSLSLCYYILRENWVINFPLFEFWLTHFKRSLIFKFYVWNFTPISPLFFSLFCVHGLKCLFKCQL